MPRPPYRFFTPLNHRRQELIVKKYEKGGLTPREDRELDMLQKVIDNMLDMVRPRPREMMKGVEEAIARINPELGKDHEIESLKAALDDMVTQAALYRDDCARLIRAIRELGGELLVSSDLSRARRRVEEVLVKHGLMRLVTSVEA